MPKQSGVLLHPNMYLNYNCVGTKFLQKGCDKYCSCFEHLKYLVIFTSAVLKAMRHPRPVLFKSILVLLNYNEHTDARCY